MHSRLRLLKGARALLYFGPLLAGLRGFGWAVVPIFVAIFVLWLFIMRPRQWPRNLAEWARPEALLVLASQVAVQVLLVVVCFGIGRGLGGVTGALPGFSLLLPLGISFLSIPLGRMLWDPWTGSDLDHFLEDAVTRGGVRVDHANADVVADGLIGALAEVPPEAGPEVLESHLRAMATQSDAMSLRLALLRQAATGGPVVQRALAVHATMPDVLAATAGTFYPFAAFQDLGRDPAVLALFATRGLAVIGADPGLWNEFPKAEALVAMAVSVPGAASDLRALAAACEQATQGAKGRA